MRNTIKKISQGSEPLRRAAAVMDLVAASAGLTVSEISLALNLPLPTTHRLVNSLTDIDYLSGGGRRSSYRLGPRFYRQLHYSLEPHSLHSIVAPLLQPLAEELMETVFMACLKGERICLGATIFPQTSMRTLIHPGHLFPVHASSAGKVICAFQTDMFIDRALSRPLQAFRHNTTTDADQVRDQYAQVRKQEFATIDDELDEGVFALSCPVRIDNQVLYSVGAVANRERILQATPLESIIDKLRDAARQLGPLLAVSVPSAVATTASGEARHA